MGDGIPVPHNETIEQMLIRRTNEAWITALSMDNRPTFTQAFVTGAVYKHMHACAKGFEFIVDVSGPTLNIIWTDDFQTTVRIGKI